jgi:dTDP-4-dehydrorhamnose 3,5-epimerase
MKLEQLGLMGVIGIANDKKSDGRGTLVRIWDEEFAVPEFNLAQGSFVSNPEPGTLRGLHFQSEPFSETKILYCVSGKIFDVVVDLRPSSPTYKKHLEIELGLSEEFVGLLIPAGFAHGYLTLEENSNLIYFMDIPYRKENADGIHWERNGLNIKWPFKPKIISQVDSELRSLQ